MASKTGWPTRSTATGISNLPDGRLSMREGEGEGHPQAFAHPAEMPADLTKA
jgi:hypothetical protein